MNQVFEYGRLIDQKIMRLESGFRLKMFKKF
ncbi:hypothetical protein Psal006b_03013 [Piscirickettsia salmonis]|uniref:Uncharacterized protein n=1 Tax=Piscirickettsia salmonis TaxID=1238 RepID=A0AAC8VFB1_PISSA|nr:hypothetical protein KU39_214 [Piscirickettsia salmonis]QGN99982.1 hypothetical protein Psal006b_03013 [Piscirickettsia salmonis]QGO03631.1 hypothetical protein Psal008_03043 [Piscirickettsia salmonis]QGO14263.1 hypothetical protein Psal010b_03006 [Piscirickettsia salmonis]QGO21361.1 hypothetical protein Psal013_03050 [Piscirickettsia salmonis]